jgi:hypothetical protein
MLTAVKNQGGQHPVKVPKQMAILTRRIVWTILKIRIFVIHKLTLNNDLQHRND